jgi:hypothetical protein
METGGMITTLDYSRNGAKSRHEGFLRQLPSHPMMNGKSDKNSKLSWSFPNKEHPERVEILEITYINDVLMKTAEVQCPYLRCPPISYRLQNYWNNRPIWETSQHNFVILPAPKWPG